MSRTPGQLCDAAILVESIADAAIVLAQTNPEAARRLTRFAVAVLPVADRVAREWTAEDYVCASAYAASDALSAMRALADDIDAQSAA